MIEMPRSEEDRVKVLDHLAVLGEERQNRHKCRWAVNHHWMLGARKFFPDFKLGVVEAAYNINSQDEQGQLRLMFEDTVVKWQAEMGRLMRMDLRPATKRKGFGLDGLRQASMGRVLLDYLTSGTDYDQFKYNLFYHMTLFGLVGVAAWPKSGPVSEEITGPTPEEEQTGMDRVVGHTAAGTDQESRVTLEVIPPWQLIPVPHNPVSPVEVRGIRRGRWVPLPWLKRRGGLSLSRDLVKLKARKAPYGVRPESDSVLDVGSSQDQALQHDVRTSRSGQGKESDVDYVFLEEWWNFHDEQDRLAQFIVKVGDTVPFFEEYKDRSVYVPVSTARYFGLGGFYGRSYVEMLIPLNSEQEQMLSSLFQNIKDLDLYGMMMVPHGLGVSKQEIQDRRTKRKVIYYTPDITFGDHKPFKLDPVNSNDFPGKVVSFGNQIMDRLANQSDMMRGDAPGRVDSQAGISLLNELSNIPLSVPAGSVANCMSQVYRAILAAAPRLMGRRGEVPLISLDDSVIGLRIKPNSDMIELDPNNYPLPSKIEVGVRDRLPVLPTLKEQKLMEMLKLGIITPRQFRVEVWKQNLDLPVSNGAERESYRKTMLQVVLLFNDGVTPGPAMGNVEADMPEVALEVIGEFMARTEFQFASHQVRLAFEQLKEKYRRALGQGYPDQLPHPEEAAELQQMMMKSGPAGGPPGAGMPMPAMVG